MSIHNETCNVFMCNHSGEKLIQYSC